MLFGVARVSHSDKSGAHEWRWSTQAQLTRREFVETSMSWAESDNGRLVATSSEEGESTCLSLVSVLFSQPVLVCVAVVWYVAVFVSGRFWVRFWRGLASRPFCVLDFPISQ